MSTPRKVLTVWDQEELHYIAERLIIELRYSYYRYDDEGNYLLEDCKNREERSAALKRMVDMQCERSYTDGLNFEENQRLREISFSEALEMPLETIKEKYLKDVLPKARGILRKGSMLRIYPYVVSDELPDSFLDDLLALRWRENMKIWAVQWKENNKDKAEKGQDEDDADDI